MEQFRIFTKLMPFTYCKTTKFWCFDVIFDVTSLMTLSRQHFCISTITYDNSLIILKISSSNSTLFRSYSLIFFELYIYIIRFLETLYTSDVTDSGTHSLGHPVLFASILVICSTLKIHNFLAFDSFYMRFFAEFVWLRRFFRYTH